MHLSSVYSFLQASKFPGNIHILCVSINMHDPQLHLYNQKWKENATAIIIGA